MTAKITHPDYKFSSKYDRNHAFAYFHKHENGFFRRLSNWQEHRVVAKALKLAGEPSTVLDLPCGTGRFWDLLSRRTERKIIASDNSLDMLETGLKLRPEKSTSQISEYFQCTAFNIPKPDDYVQSVFSIRFLHHIHSSQDRIKLLKEFCRVSSDTVIFSLWVDGNYKARRYQNKKIRKDRENPTRVVDRILVERAEIEAEIHAAGLEIVGHVDFIKHYSKWRTYVARKIKSGQKVTDLY